MDGILLVNKPVGYTSHDIVNKLRGFLNTKKIGHTGTLDPDASGLLVCGINKGTKIMKYLNNDTKVYNAEICIGKSTDTLDKTGEVLEEKRVKKLKNVDAILKTFMDPYVQIPPMYSAVKYKGKRLYEYARKGIEITDRPKREIQVDNIKRTSEISYDNDYAYFNYYVKASKGLYVRTLSYDIGKKLGYPAHNYNLERLQAGEFSIEQSYTLKEIEANQYKIISLSDALSFIPTYPVIDDYKKHIQHGMAISLDYFNDETRIKIVDDQGDLRGIYKKHPKEPKMVPENIFHKD
ncbi:MAG: tRNA pseudouridine(55) synthase TruB [Candidatus Izimaplasma sp.]|nr:tRNA pseudouridine(55) synthase TruB [Candidatus Izimaplasma bacterium]